MEQTKIKLTIVVGVLNQFKLVDRALSLMVSKIARPQEVELIVIDNGSEPQFSGTEFPAIAAEPKFKELASLKIVRNDHNTGNYPMFRQGYEYAKGEIVAFLHSDVFIYQDGWDDSVIAQFDGREDLGLVGFIGSTEIDFHGGRGGGTVSNMQGRTVLQFTNAMSLLPPTEALKQWTGSAGHIHGRQSGGMTVDGSVVDGCVMIFRKSVLSRIGFKDTLPPHHFYDRIMSVQVAELGYRVGILGIEFDHVSGQVANHEQKWQDTSKEWFKSHLGLDTPQAWAELRKDWVNNGNNPSVGKIPDQWDYAAYLEAEYQFLSEYRDQKRLIPMFGGKRV